jgi:hypothetical protein
LSLKWLCVRGALLLLSLAGAGCVTTIVLPPAPDDAPLVRRIDARVGTVYPDEVRRSVRIHNSLHRVEIGAASVVRFQQAFAAMFEATEPLPEQPPWQSVLDGMGIDGVVVLEDMSAELNDAGITLYNGQRVGPITYGSYVSYRVCLYEPDGTQVQCWRPSGSSTYQTESSERAAFCSFGERCAELGVEEAMREAITAFLVEAESDPVLSAWAARVAARRSGR